jgi:hypothetical protein
MTGNFYFDTLFYVSNSLQALPQPFQGLLVLLWLIFWFVVSILSFLLSLPFLLFGIELNSIAPVTFYLVSGLAILVPSVPVLSIIYALITGIPSILHPPLPGAKKITDFCNQLDQEDSRFDALRIEFGDYMRKKISPDFESNDWLFVDFEEFKQHFEEFLATRLNT